MGDTKHSSSGKQKESSQRRRERAWQVISCSQPRAVVGGLNWLSCLFVLQFCNVFQLSFRFLYRCIYFLMILRWGVSAKRTENQRQQRSASLLPSHGASEDFAFHTSFTARRCKAATKPAPAQAPSHHHKQQLAARIQDFTEKKLRGKVLYKEPTLWKVSIHCRNETFLFSMNILFKPNHPAYANICCVLKEM